MKIMHIKNRAWSPSLPSSSLPFPSLHHIFYISKIQDGPPPKKKYSVQGVGGGGGMGGIGVAPITKMGVKQTKKYSVQGLGGRWWGGGVQWGAPYKKKGVQFIFLQLSRGPEGPSRWSKATSPPQELEVGAHRAPYHLVIQYNNIQM